MMQQQASTACDDENWGYFDVWLTRVQSGMYKLSVIPVQVNPGDIVKITLTDSYQEHFREILSQATVYNDEEIVVAYLSDSDIYNYPNVAITPYDQTGVPFQQQNTQVAAVCALPVVDDGTGTLGDPSQRNY